MFDYRKRLQNLRKVLNERNIDSFLVTNETNVRYLSGFEGSDSLILVTKDSHVKPYVIPGIGYTSSEVPFDFSITVAYRLPLIKTKVIPKQLKTGGQDRQDSDQDLDPNDPDYNNQNGNNRNSRTNSGSIGGNNRQF